MLAVLDTKVEQKNAVIRIAAHIAKVALETADGDAWIAKLAASEAHTMLNSVDVATFQAKAEAGLE